MTEAPRRYFIGVAVTNPAPGSALERLPHAESDGKALAAAFGALKYEAVDTSTWSEGEELTATQFAAGVAEWRRAVNPGDSVIFYFYGHALRSEAFDKHYLCFRGCEPDAPHSGGFPVAELATIFLDGPRRPVRAWFILDCCYSGQGAADLAGAFAAYQPTTASDDAATYWVTSSCGRVVQYADGAFRRALAAALSRANTMQEVQQALKQELGPRARQVPRTRQLYGNTDFLSADIAGRARGLVPASEAASVPRSPRRRAVLRAVLTAAVLSVSWVAWSRLQQPGPEAAARSSADMAWIERADLAVGVEEAEARRAFADCRVSYGDACGQRFESSVFAREVRPPGARPVPVGGFYLDKTEVSRRAFVRWLNRESATLRLDGTAPTQRVLDASGHALAAVRTGPAEQAKSETGAEAGTAIRYGDRSFFLDGEQGADNPVTLVSWHGARRFCEAQGKRLPTEHEWELAARGSAGRRFPWGETPPERCEDVVFARAPGAFCERAARGPMPVGSSRGDVTRDGVRDLGGNVSEWTASTFEDGGVQSPCGNAAGPCRVLRGGSYTDGPLVLRGSTRMRRGENELWLNLGFRCARGGPVES